MSQASDHPVPSTPPSAPPERLGAGPAMGRRLVALVVLLASGAVLGIAVWLAPDARGHGTHEQLGLPKCNWVQYFGKPCPTCGMTTSFTHAAGGDFAGSFRAQPMGFLLAIATACAFLMSLYVSVTGSAVASSLGRLWRPRVVWLLVGLLAAAWVYKVLTFPEVS